MKKQNQREKRLNQDTQTGNDRNSLSSDITRREFVHYSTFALVAAAISVSFTGCGGDGGDNGDDGGNNISGQQVFDQTSIKSGQVLGIKNTGSPGPNVIPEDIYSVMIRVDEQVTYELRPTHFKEGWIGVAIPPMIQSDGNYFETKETEAVFMIQGAINGKSSVSVTQDLTLSTDGETLLSLINAVGTELDSIHHNKETLFEDVAILDKWNEAYPMVKDGLAWLSDIIYSMRSEGTAEVTTIGGETCIITRQDIALAELMVTNVTAYEADGMANAFFDSLPTSGRTVVKKLTGLLGYVEPGAFINMTREWSGTTSGRGAIAAILSVAVPAACMCVAGNCFKKLAESATSVESFIYGINWYSNFLINQGLYALNNDIVCKYGIYTNEIIELVTMKSIDLLEDISESLLGDIPWSNSTPWSNGTPWTNSIQWNNNVWTNQPWSHTPWNNAGTWNNTTPWNNNAWSHATPWSNAAWSNTTPWNNNAWSNSTPWSNNTWNNNWNNNIWSNNPWNNFVNSGIKINIEN